MLISRRQLFRLAATGAATWVAPTRTGWTAAPSALWKFAPEDNLIPAPEDPALWPEFRRQLGQWRAEKRATPGYSDALYQREEFSWTAASFACAFLMLTDELFLDARTGRFNVARWLAHGRQEFGGFDSVVLWHAYPRIGLDDRNQFDFYRDQPGGLAGLRQAVAEFHRAAVRVFLDYNPWDTNTRREGRDDLTTLAALVAELDADGLFLDTMDRGDKTFRATLDAARPGVALEGEIALPLERVHDHHLSWAQWFKDSHVPGVLRNRWFERRHQQHQVCRWDRDHAAEIHTAWMNGAGMLIWENVFGTWNGWSDRDKSILRSMLPIQRRYAALFRGEQWSPLVPTLHPEVYASLWESPGLRLWTLVNRAARDAQGELLEARFGDGEKVWDPIVGHSAAVSRRAGGARPTTETAVVPITGFIPARGIGCFIAGRPEALGSDFPGFLESQREVLKRANWSTAFPARKAALRPVPKVALPQAAPQADMVAVPGGRLRLKTTFRVRECGFYDATHPHFATSFPELHKPLVVERDVELKRFAVDVNLVTNADFARFLQASGYRPADRTHFLRHWGQDAPLPELAGHPVVYVDLNDARAYAAWAGKRLPTEEEWQFAAQGTDGRRYPWGDTMEPGRCNDGSSGRTTPVGTYPAGRSPFGCLDCCGNVWEWTESQHSDGRTRFALLRGGSFYRRGGSGWYFDEGPQPVDFAAKVLLSSPGLDRCATVGFRCAVDLSG